MRVELLITPVFSKRFLRDLILLEFLTATVDQMHLLSKAKLEAAFKVFDEVFKYFTTMSLLFEGWKWVSNN